MTAAVVAAVAVWIGVSTIPPRPIQLAGAHRRYDPRHPPTSTPVDSDGLSGPDENSRAAAARRAGLKFLVFTDHGDATTQAGSAAVSRRRVVPGGRRESAPAAATTSRSTWPASPYPPRRPRRADRRGKTCARLGGVRYRRTPGLAKTGAALAGTGPRRLTGVETAEPRHRLAPVDAAGQRQLPSDGRQRRRAGRSAGWIIHSVPAPGDREPDLAQRRHPPDWEALDGAPGVWSPSPGVDAQCEDIAPRAGGRSRLTAATALPFSRPTNHRSA